MKNFIVKSLRGFDDYEGKDIDVNNPHIHREIGTIFKCTKERYIYLDKMCAVELVGIETEEPKEEQKPIKKVSKKNK